MNKCPCPLLLRPTRPGSCCSPHGVSLPSTSLAKGSPKPTPKISPRMKPNFSYGNSDYSLASSSPLLLTHSSPSPPMAQPARVLASQSTQAAGHPCAFASHPPPTPPPVLLLPHWLSSPIPGAASPNKVLWSCPASSLDLDESIGA